MLNSEAEDWPVEITYQYDARHDRRIWTIRYVSGEKENVTSLDELRKLIGETNFTAWSTANG